MRGTFFQLFCLILWLNAFSDGFGATPVSPTDKKLSPEKTSNCVEGDLLPRSTKSERITEAEDKFCAEIRQNPDLQAIYGFVITPRIAQIVRVYKDKAVFTYYEDNVRFKERTLSRTETAALQKRIAEDKPEQQAPLRDLLRCVDMCLGYEFLSINQNGGRRVDIVAPRYRPPAPMDALANLFEDFIKAGNFKTRYYIQDENKDFRILFADDVWHAQAVWKNGDDLRVLVNNAEKWYEDIKASIEYSDKTFPSESFEKRWLDLRRRDEIEYANYFWHRFKNGKLGEKVPPPAGVPYSLRTWLHSTKDFRIETVCKDKNQCALFKVDASGKLNLIKEGGYQRAVVSPDGRWAVAVKKNEEMWDKLFRINLETNEVFPVDWEASYFFDVIGYIEAHNKFLVRQRKFTGYLKPDALIGFLLDAETGKLEKVDGNFDPLTEQNFKPLQPTRQPDVFWAAKNNYNGTTEFGVYDTKTFAFKPLARWTGIEFGSDKMWVDEKEKKIFFIYQGHLLSLPLPKAP